MYICTCKRTRVNICDMICENLACIIKMCKMPGTKMLTRKIMRRTDYIVRQEALFEEQFILTALAPEFNHANGTPGQQKYCSSVMQIDKKTFFF